MRASEIAKLLVLILIIAACGAAESGEFEAERGAAVADRVPAGEPPERDQELDAWLARQDEAMAARFPCSLFTQEEVGLLAGNPVESGYAKIVTQRGARETDLLSTARQAAEQIVERMTN